MKIALRSLSFVCVGAVIVAGSARAGADLDPTLYAGTKSCRMCHKKEASGNQYGKWQEGPHAKAYEVLATDEAKAVAAKLGIADAQKSGKCLKCHATAYHFGEEVKTEKVTAEEGVSCESCHGPGKKYKSKTVMKDHARCIENGMVYPATKNCKLCHNDTAPSWKADRYTTKDGKKVGFDAEQAYKKIAHPNPKLQK